MALRNCPLTGTTMPDFSLPPIKDRFSINVIEDSDSRLLLLKRSKDADLGPGKWGFPAGHIEAGETPEECALRELKEEIGPIFTVEQAAAIGPVRDSCYGGIYEIHLFHHHWLAGRITLNHEHSQYAWVDRESYKTYPVMDGVDEDICYFGIWPRRYLNQEKLPASRSV